MLAAVACMALALYFEARGEPVVGQIAVGHVISNRVADPRYPDTVCEVVMQGPTYSWKPDFPARLPVFILLRWKIRQAEGCRGIFEGSRVIENDNFGGDQRPERGGHPLPRELCAA